MAPPARAAAPVTSIRVVGAWSAARTSVAEVEAAIADLRRREERAAVRTAVLNLVAVAAPDDCPMLLDMVHELGARHPSHALIVVAGDPAGEPRIDADVRVHVLERDGRAVSYEDVLLRVEGPAVRHLDSVVEPFALPDLPVAVWLPRRLPDPADPLLQVADRVVVDSKEVGDAAAFPDLVWLCRRFPVVDLSWVRLTPWRELTAGLFEGSAFRPFVAGVTAVRVAGKEGPRHLLGGWLASRLHLPAAAVTVSEDVHAGVEIDAEAGGRRARFVVARPAGDRIVHATAAVEGGPSHDRTLRLPERSPARVLGHALGRPDRDRTYEHAVAAAVDLAAGAGAGATPQ